MKKNALNLCEHTGKDHALQLNDLKLIYMYSSIVSYYAHTKMYSIINVKSTTCGLS